MNIRNRLLLITIAFATGCSVSSDSTPLRPKVTVKPSRPASSSATTSLGRTTLSRVTSPLSSSRKVAKVSLSTRAELTRAFTVVSDHTHGELERNLYSKRNQQGSGFRFGGISRVQREYILPTVLVGDELDRTASALMSSVFQWKHRLAALPPPPKGHMVRTPDGPEWADPPEDPYANERADLKANISKYEKRAPRLQGFVNRHRKEADQQHSTAIILEEYIVDLIHVPVIDDVNVHAELKLFLSWRVDDGKLVFDVSNLSGDDLWAETGHLGAVLAGYGGKPYPAEIGRRLGWTYAGLPLQNILPEALAKVRAANGLLPSVSIRIDDLALEGDELIATVSWGLD